MARLQVEHSIRAIVRFAGFTSDTPTLARHGWDIAVQRMGAPYHPHDDFEMVLRHRDFGVTAIAIARNFYGNVFDERYKRLTASMVLDSERVVFEVMKCSQGLRVHGVGAIAHYSAFSLIEAQTKMVMIDEYELCQLPAFAEVGARSSEELIVDPMDVSQLLDLIRNKQAPAQAGIRDRIRKREIVPVEHAKIFTFPTAA